MEKVVMTSGSGTEVNGAGRVLFTKILNNNDIEKALLFLDDAFSKGFSRVAFLDTPCCPALREVIDFAIEKMMFSVYLRDHHAINEAKSPRDQEIIDAARLIKNRLGSNAIVTDRQTTPACSAIIEEGEFPAESFLIIADADPDGLTATLKARGLVYNALDHDSAILDGPHSQRTINSLSRIGWKLHQVFATVNEHNRQSVFERFIDYITGDPEAEQFIEASIEEYEAQVAEAGKIAQTAEQFTSKMWLVDVTNFGKYDTATLSRLVEANDGCEIVVTVQKGGAIGKLFGKQYSIALKKGVEGVDFKQLLPAGFVSSPEAGLICNTPFLMYCNQDQWQTVVLPALATIK